MRSQGERLQIELTKKHKTVSDAARSLGMTYHNIKPYLDNVRPIGAALRERLREKGYDVEYILTGSKSKTDFNVTNTVQMNFSMPGHISPGKATQLKVLVDTIAAHPEADIEMIQEIVNSVLRQKK